MVISNTMSASEIDNQLWGLYVQYGLVNRKFTKGRLGLLTSAIATELSTILSILNGYVNQFSILTCTDPALIESMIKPFVVRQGATSSRVLLTFTRVGDFTESIRIPHGFAVSNSGDSTIIFKTASDIFLWKGQQTASGVAYCVNTGSRFNVSANTLTYFSDSIWNSRLAVNNNAPAFGGKDEESIESAKQRATMFRYDRDGTSANVRSQFYQLGLDSQQYKIIEYGRGYGTLLIILDTDSEAEFEDLQNTIIAGKVAGVKYYFTKATRKYINFYVHLKTTGSVDYTDSEKEQMYTIVQNTIQNIFAYYLSVGADLSVNRLVTEINTQLADSYDIYSVDVTFDDGIIVGDNNKIDIAQDERVYTNKIITDIVYVGS